MSASAHDATEVTRRILAEHGGGGRNGPRQIFIALTRTRRGQIGLILLAIFVLMAIVGTYLAPQDPNAPGSFSANAAENLQSPSSAHWLGTDESGRGFRLRLRPRSGPRSARARDGTDPC